MDKHLVGLERAQEEFHQAFDTRMEDVEEHLMVVRQIWMLRRSECL